MLTEQPPPGPHVLKIGGVTAAQFAETTDLIRRFSGPLIAVISAPNFKKLRTTDTLISAAEALSQGEKEKTMSLLESFKDTLLWSAFSSGIKRRNYREDPYKLIKIDIEKLFKEVYRNIDRYFQAKADGENFDVTEPCEENDYVAEVTEKSSGQKIRIPLMALGEDCSALVYARLARGKAILHHEGHGKTEAEILAQATREKVLVISGALQFSPEEQILQTYGRGYTDATAVRLAVHAQWPLSLHKEHGIRTADADIVNGPGKTLNQISLKVVRILSEDPLIRAQFLNAHAFDHGVPPKIFLGNFHTGNITEILPDMDIENPLPIIQKGPRVRLESFGQFPFGKKASVTLDSEGELNAISIVDHVPRSTLRAQELLDKHFVRAPMDVRGQHVTTILVPHRYANDAVRDLHKKICE